MMNIPITKPYLDKDDEKSLAKVLQSGWLTQGPKVAEFEHLVADYVGARYAVTCNSCTSALFLCLKLLGIGEGDEVIVPSYTFIATANVVELVGAIPVFADIDIETLNIDPADIRRKITKRTRAIIAVDQVGLPADLFAIHKIAGEYHLHVIEDAACALGSVHQGKKIGAISELTCFSFHPRKVITTGEGGMITTNNKKYARILRELASHGAAISEISRHKARRTLSESYERCGYNFRLSDLQGALGITQMKKLDSLLRRRIALAQRYNEQFKQSARLKIPAQIPGRAGNYQTYMIRLVGISVKKRDIFIKSVKERGIAIRTGIMAIHKLPLYIGKYGKIVLPNTETAWRESVILPLYPQMTAPEQKYIIETVLKTLNKI